MCFVTDLLNDSERERGGGCVLVSRGNLPYTDRDRLGFIQPGNLQLKWSEEGVAAHTADTTGC